MKYIIIFTLTQNPCNVKVTEYDNIWGLGDIIRGLIGVYQLCKKNNFQLYYNIDLHPVAKFLDNDSSHFEYINEHQNEIYFYNNENDIINNLHADKPLLLLSNLKFKDELTEDCISYVKRFLNTNRFFNQRVSNDNIYFNEHSYSVLHYRIAGIRGDQKQFFHKKNFHNYLQHINKYYQNNMIVLCDNQEFKDTLDPRIKTSKSLIGHFGIETNDEIMFGILLDMHLMKHANIIYYHPTNGPSGLIKIINYLWKIKLIKLV